MTDRSKALILVGFVVLLVVVILYRQGMDDNTSREETKARCLTPEPVVVIVPEVTTPSQVPVNTTPGPSNPPNKPPPVGCPFATPKVIYKVATPTSGP